MTGKSSEGTCWPHFKRWDLRNPSPSVLCPPCALRYAKAWVRDCGHETNELGRKLSSEDIVDNINCYQRLENNFMRLLSYKTINENTLDCRSYYFKQQCRQVLKVKDQNERFLWLLNVLSISPKGNAIHGFYICSSLALSKNSIFCKTSSLNPTRINPIWLYC